MGKKVKLFWLGDHSKTERHFDQGNFISAFQKHSSIGSEVSEGICYGICVEGMRKAGKGGYPAEAALVSTVSKMRALSESDDKSDIEKLKRMALRIYTQQNYLQAFLGKKFPTSLVPTGGITGERLEECIQKGNGVTDIGLYGDEGGHAIYIIQSETLGPNKETLYRVFDPNYGYSEPMTVGETIDQINAINNFYFKAKKIPVIGDFSRDIQKLTEIKYLQPGAPKHCAKPSHVIRILEGISPVNPNIKPDLDANKMIEDLGFEFINHIIFSYCVDQNIKPNLAALRNFRLFLGEKNIAEFYQGLAFTYPKNDFEKVFGPFIDEDARLSNPNPPTPLEKLLEQHPKAVLRMCAKEMAKGVASLPKEVDANALSFREQRFCARIVQTFNENSEKKFSSLTDGIKAVINAVMSLISSEFGLKNKDFQAAYADLQTRLGNDIGRTEGKHASKVTERQSDQNKSLGA